MNVPYAVLVPVLLTAATAAYVFAGPSHSSHQSARAEEVVAAPDTSTPADAGTAAPTPTVVPGAMGTPDPVPGLPRGLAGQLTYRTGTGRQLVTVQFPDATELSRQPDPGVTAGDVSADGTWRSQLSCPSTDAQQCSLQLIGADGTTRTIGVSENAQRSHGLQWSPEGHTLVLMSSSPDGSSGLAVVSDPAIDDPRELALEPGESLTDFAWMADSRTVLVATTHDGAQGKISRLDTESGEVTTVTTLPQAATYLYPSPDRSLFAFTGSTAKSWDLYVLDPLTASARDLGPMGSDTNGGLPVNVPLDVKGPMYIGWSPDSTRVAFGGGLEPPYVMTTIDLRSGKVLRTEFPDGYPGEIKWSPDGARIAVSAYNVPRTHHESYIVDPNTGVATDVLSGCVIVWSPDSRFLAIHGERIPGVAIADVVRLEHTQLTHGVGDTPLRWEP